MLTPSDYRYAKEEQAELHSQMSKAREDLLTKITTIERDVYEPKLDAIRAERDATIAQIEEKAKATAEIQQKKMEGVSAEINEVNRCLDLIEVAKQHTDDLGFRVYRYNGRDKAGEHIKEYFSPFATIADDQYKKVHVFVVPNRKPVKKFSLFIAGNTIFYHRDKQFIDRNVFYGYINGVNEENAQIRVVLRDAATEKELTDWYDKHKATVLKEFLAEHAEIEQEYEAAKKLAETLEWQVLYLERKKEYYERDYHRGTDTEEYKQVMEELLKLKVA